MRQTIFLIVLVVALVLTGYFLYQYFFGSQAETVEAPAGTRSELLSRYRQIKSLKPDLSIFTDPFFRSLFSPLQTFGTGTSTKTSTVPGRKNPFAPF
ncbi:MAG: hypothetical protein HYW90_02800 [Candidatus Sungbacteria bacterium]|nr:hypothetical protein [Candidatus Sungbacteria bacterium]